MTEQAQERWRFRRYENGATIWNDGYSGPPFNQDIEVIPASRERALRGFAEWIVALDEPDSAARRTVTLTQIIHEASKALAEQPGGEGP
jgi:hypothetical protein